MIMYNVSKLSLTYQYFIGFFFEEKSEIFFAVRSRHPLTLGRNEFKLEVFLMCARQQDVEILSFLQLYFTEVIVAICVP